MNQPNLLPEHSWAIPQRQANAGLVIIIANAATRLIKMLWPFLLVVLFKGNKKGIDSFEITLIALPVIILVRSLVEFFYFRFFIVHDELTIRKGFISKKTLTIPLGKIQGVHIEQGLLHQVANVAKVKIDTAGSEKTEAVIDAISMGKAEQLKAFLMHEKQVASNEGTPVPVQRDIPVMHLSATDLLKIGFSANHIQALFVVLIFTMTSINNLGEIFGDTVYKRIESSGDVVSDSVVVATLAILAVLIISVMVSLVRILLRYFDFQLSETTQGFKIKTGLINTQQTLVPFNKIQYVSWEANWIRRKIGLYTMEFHQVTGNDRQSKKQRVKVPLTQFAFVDKMLAHYHGKVQSSDAAGGHGIHTSYIFRHTLWFAILPVSLLTGVLLLATHNLWWLLLLLYIPIAAGHSFFFRRNFRLFTGEEALQVNSGIWGRKVEIVQWYKTQQVLLNQSIYQRQHELATLHLNTAGGRITIPYIPLKLAQEIRDYTLYKVESSERNWM